MHKGLIAPLGHFVVSLVAVFMLCSPVTADTGANAEERVTVNMYRADVDQVLQWLAELRGLNILIDPRVEGELSILAAEPVSPQQAESLVLSALDMYGYGIEMDNKQVRVMPAQATGPGTIVETFTSEPNSARMIYLYWPKTVSAQSLAKLMAPLKGENGFIQAFDDQALLLSDAGDRVKRLRTLAIMIDSGAETAPTFFALEHADASAMVTLLRGLFDGQRLTIAADEYSASLLVSAAPALIKQVERIIRQLDQRLISSEEAEVVELRFSQVSDLLPALRSVNERQGSEEALQGRGHIEAVESANALILSGPTPWRRETLSVIRQLDQPRQQVLVESVIMEVSDGLITELGVEWNTDVNGEGIEALTRFGIQNSEIPPLIEEWTGAGLALGWFRNGSLRAVVRAAANDSGTRILSTPRLATLNHAPAEILVGSNIPVKTGEALVGSSGESEPFTTIERKDIGIVLKVTPHINADGDVTLDIEQTVESVAPSNATDTDIVTNKRQLKTRVRVQNETVLVLGGLSSQESNEVVSKVPLLGDIPVMGALFRNTRNETVNRHLMVFIQPKLITDPSTAEAVSSEAWESFRDNDTTASAVAALEAKDREVSQDPEDRKSSEWRTVNPADTAATEVVSSANGEKQPLAIRKPAPTPEPSSERTSATTERMQTGTSAKTKPSPETALNYQEETIILDDQQAHITRSQGVRGAFVALSENEATAAADPTPTVVSIQPDKETAVELDPIPDDLVQTDEPVQPSAERPAPPTTADAAPPKDSLPEASQSDYQWP